mmetsp:Transcript_10787/g.40488  ORF Transcript_10787/g.40488 Transcript_10787/m.40488 type:complete len:275 (+) Transcript_10787:1645-2469(+)
MVQEARDQEQLARRRRRARGWGPQQQLCRLQTDLTAEQDFQDHQCTFGQGLPDVWGQPRQRAAYSHPSVQVERQNGIRASSEGNRETSARRGKQVSQHPGGHAMDRDAAPQGLQGQRDCVEDDSAPKLIVGEEPASEVSPKSVVFLRNRFGLGDLRRSAMARVARLEQLRQGAESQRGASTTALEGRGAQFDDLYRHREQLLSSSRAALGAIPFEEMLHQDSQLRLCFRLLVKDVGCAVATLVRRASALQREAQEFLVVDKAAAVQIHFLVEPA